MKKNHIIALALSLMLALSLSACSAEEEKKPEKRLPQDVVSDVPLPYTGEVGRPINPVAAEVTVGDAGTGEDANTGEGAGQDAPGSADPGLQIYQINDDGTSQEITPGGTPPSLEAPPAEEAPALD